MLPQYFPSTPVNTSCTRRIFRKQSARPQNLPTISVGFPCIYGTYRKLASTFREAGVPPVNFPYYRASMHSVSLRRLYACPQDHLSTFVRPWDLPSTFRVPQVLSSAFRMAAGGQGTSCQLSVQPVDFPSSFLVSAGPVNFVQLPNITW